MVSMSKKSKARMKLRPWILEYATGGGEVFHKSFATKRGAMQSARRLWKTEQATPMKLVHEGDVIYDDSELWVRICGEPKKRT